MSLCGLSAFVRGVWIKMGDPESLQNPCSSRSALSNGTLLLPIAQVNFYHPHGFQNLPGLLRGQVQSC